MPIQPLSLVILVAVAAAAGGMLRFAISSTIARHWGVKFPLATLVINSSGAFAIGLVAALMLTIADFSSWSMIIIVGFLGSYTTVSSFSLQTVSLWHSRHYQLALLNIGLSFGLAISLVFAGFCLGSWLW